jgi:beta-phosphoglucomutase-like phosphatase (HAD superfamily)
VIEDAAFGIQAAKAAGMKAFGFIGAPDAHDDIEQRLTAAGADLIFDRMAQLPDLLKSI